ncbi:phosphoribosylaminoimidazole carboxylase ATPase subunit [Legionella steelei]|uniref:N5-carboxyaminoimidazole ribonucleotide synthase n=1 Tax=Legionella steelei TaxID=947033 RepID=A0A0W0ZJC5_9GAMM|nr:5-(carboxyamino)imidazole ribonucleotide synthase [Legionella steelei]KTD69277.1 phosphoribosylaminoimidazole carboxylase ATPase subunit [Legionella steelei]
MKLGILGGGQLARMLALAAYPLGIDTVCLDPSPDACAGDLTKLIVAEFNDELALKQFLAEVDCVTIETENIPLSCAELVATMRPFYPSTQALKITQDRLYEKNFFRSLNIPTPRFLPVESEHDLVQSLSDIGMPAVLKTRQFGYDGKGQYVLRGQSDISKSWNMLGNQPLILEELISFENEFSLIAVRNKKCETNFYPLIKNHHKKGILHFSEAPVHHRDLQQEAQTYALKILEALDYVGVLTIEFFYRGNQLIANEIAPRVHNSGHWTIEGAYTSQFENHLRALFDLPLGSTEVTGSCLLLNCIGNLLPLESCLSIPGVHYHAYGKKPRIARKVGHVTLVDTHWERYAKSKDMLLQLAAEDESENT